MDFSILPPEVNSGLIYTGPGSGPLIAAATAWSTLSQDLVDFAAEAAAAIGSLSASWLGPSSTAMQTAAQPYLAWLTTSAAQASATAVQAQAAAGAFELARAASVPPPLIAANRAQLLLLVATNLLGQNTPAIAANEAAYAQMWAQDAAAMNAYAATSAATTAALPSFQAAPQTTSGSPATAATTVAASLGTGGMLDNSSTVGQYLQALVSSGFPFDVAQLFANFIGLQEVAASNVQGAQIRASTPPVVIPPAPPATMLTPAGSTPVEAPISAVPGVSNNIGRLSAPPSWARPPVEVAQPPRVTVNPGPQRFQAGIPVPPAIPVVTAGRSKQSRVRDEPEYGHASSVVPPKHPHPSAG